MTLRLRIMALVPVLLVTAVTSAHAMTAKEAQSAALAAVKKVKSIKFGTTPTVMYGTDHAVKDGSQVWWSVGPSLRRTTKERPPLTRAELKQDTWLFWLDTNWGAKLIHPTYIVEVNDVTKKVTTVAKTNYWPVIDGDPPPYVTWGRFDPRFQVFSNVPSSDKQELGSLGTAPLATAASPVRAVAPIRAPQGSLNGACIITIGEANVIKANADFLGVLNLGKDLQAAGTGLKVFRAAGGKEFPGMPTGEDLHDDIRSLIKNQACTEILVYINGHASPTGNTTDSTSVLVGSSDWKAAGKNKGLQMWQQSTAWVGFNDLTRTLRDFRSTHFDFVIDAPGSGRYRKPLQNFDRSGQVHVGAFSSQAKELSYFYLPMATGKTSAQNTTDNPGNFGKPGRSEFTNGFLSGLRTFFSNDTTLRNARSVPGASLFAQGLTFAAQAAQYGDLAAKVQLNKPTSFTDQKLMPSGPGPATGAVTTQGSSLEPGADLALGSPEDEDFWDTLLASQPATILADGQIVKIRVKGMALTPTGAPAPLTEIHFVLLRPQPDGSVITMQSSQAFNLPDSGDPNQIKEFVPENFCVKTGDFLALSTEGGFDPTWYPNGVSFQIFAAVPGSTLDFYTKHNGVQNNSQFTGTSRPETELLMNWDLATGDKASPLCHSGPRR